MRAAVLIAAVAAAAYASYEAIHFWSYYREVRALLSAAVPFERQEGKRHILVLGDSIAYGIGADHPNGSIAGRLAQERIDHSVENHSVIGARIPDLSDQVKRARSQRYELALIAIGANDIIRFKSASIASDELEQFLQTIRPRVGTIVLLTAGNIGAAPIFPRPLRPFYRSRTLDYHRAFQQVADRTGSIYVNLYEEPEKDPFVQQPERFFARDGLHPSSEGYRLYFERIQKRL